MKTYEPSKAASILKSGPSGETYHFIKGHEIGPHTLADERWMNNLVSLGTLRVVTNDRVEKTEEKPKKKVITAKDVLPDLPEKSSKKKIGRKTKEEKEAEEKVAKQNEEAEKKAKENALDEPEFEDEQQQAFFEFVKTLREKTTIRWL